MEENIEYKGKTYPIRLIPASALDIIGLGCFRVADIELWAVIEEDCKQGGNVTANEIDNSILYYCDSGFIASNPTDEELIKYIKSNL